jgi:hypothetical protein
MELEEGLKLSIKFSLKLPANSSDFIYLVLEDQKEKSVIKKKII